MSALSKLTFQLSSMGLELKKNKKIDSSWAPHDEFSAEDITPQLCLTAVIPEGEDLYIVDGHGVIQFVAGDRPQELFGFGEACLVRNHRFPMAYHIRTTGMVSYEQIKVIWGHFSTADLAMRHANYLKDMKFIDEPVVGRDYGHLALHLDADHSVWPLETYSSMVVYNQFQTRLKASTTENSPSSGRSVSGTYRLEPSQVQQSTPLPLDAINKAAESRLRAEAPSFLSLSKGMAEGKSMSSDDQYEVQLKEQTRINEAMYHTKRYLTEEPQDDFDSYTANGRFFRHASVHSDENKTMVDDQATSSADGKLLPMHHNKSTNPLYKTEMCKNWSEIGDCRYGRSCQFAHGKKEIRPLKRHRQWKTKTCLAWARGGCTYHHRCCYAHEWLPNNGGHPPHIKLDELRRTFHRRPSTESTSSDSSRVSPDDNKLRRGSTTSNEAKNDSRGRWDSKYVAFFEERLWCNNKN